MKKLYNSQNIYILGGLLLLVGAITHFFKFIYAPYLFAIGTIMIVYYQFAESWNFRKGDDRRMQRLKRLGFLSSVILAPGAYMMFNDKSNIWVMALLIYAVTTFFLSFRGKKQTS